MMLGSFIASASFVGLLWFYFHFLRSQYATIADAFALPDRFQNMTREPVLQRSPMNDLEEFKRTQSRMLHSYTWQSRENGVVSIPVDRAIEAITRNGLPAAESMPGLQLGVPSTTHRQTGLDRFVNSPEESR